MTVERWETEPEAEGRRVASIRWERNLVRDVRRDLVVWRAEGKDDFSLRKGYAEHPKDTPRFYSPSLDLDYFDGKRKGRP